MDEEEINPFAVADDSLFEVFLQDTGKDAEGEQLLGEIFLFFPLFWPFTWRLTDV